MAGLLTIAARLQAIPAFSQSGLRELVIFLHFRNFTLRSCFMKIRYLYKNGCLGSMKDKHGYSELTFFGVIRELD
jgi:hypothetical protein